MMVNDYQHKLLIRMGIPVWQKRSSAAAAMENQPTISLHDERLQQRRWLLLPAKTLNGTEKKLLTAMLKSIDLSLHDVALFDAEDVDIMKQHATVSHQVLVFDEKLSIDEAVSWVVAPSLQQLMSQPAMKQLAWQALQQYAQLN